MVDLLDEWEAAGVLPVDQLARARQLTTPGPSTAGARIVDHDRGVTYRVTLDTTKHGEPRLHSVEVERDRVEPGLRGMTMKGGTIRPKGRVGAYLEPYDESVFRVPVKDLIAQASAVVNSPHIVIAARTLAPPTPEQLRVLIDEMTVQQIADRYERKPRMVYEWLAAARAKAPKLDWPPVTHGPRTKTPDGKQPSGHRGRKTK